MISPIGRGSRSRGVLLLADISGYSDVTLGALDVPAEGMLAGVETSDDLPSLEVHVLALT